jgi:hypothetical protein
VQWHSLLHFFLQPGVVPLFDIAKRHLTYRLKAYLVRYGTYVSPKAMEEPVGTCGPPLHVCMAKLAGFANNCGNTPLFQIYSRYLFNVFLNAFQKQAFC